MRPLTRLFWAILAVARSSTGSGSRGAGGGSSRYYDKQVNVFNAEGDLPQLTYADIAASRGDSLICIATEDNCVVLCTPTGSRAVLQDRRVIDKISKVDDGIWAAFAGLAGDGRALIRISRKLSASYRLSFNAPPTLRFLTKSIADVSHEATLSGSERPYGVNLLILGFEPGAESPQVFLSKASGHLSQWRAVAIGRNYDRALAHLEARLVANSQDKLVRKPATVLQAAEMALDIFRQEDMRSSFGAREAERDRDEDAAEAGTSKTAPAAEEAEQGGKCDLYLLRRNIEGHAVLTMAAGVANVAELDGAWKIVPGLNNSNSSISTGTSDDSTTSSTTNSTTTTTSLSGGFSAAPAEAGRGKERRALRAIANRLKTQSALAVLSCSGVSDSFVANAKEVLAARSLLQVRFSAPDKKEVKMLCESLALATGAEVVQVLGHTGLFFLPSPRGGEMDKLLAQELASTK